MSTQTTQCPLCRADILVMTALNNRKIPVDVASVDELVCRIAGGRLLFDRAAGHVPHADTCKQGWRMRSAARQDDVADEAEQRAEFRRQHQKRRAARPNVKPAPSPIEAAYRELQLDIGVAPVLAKAAYRRLAREFHPDVNPHGLSRMQSIASAYDVLRRQGLA